MGLSIGLGSLVVLYGLFVLSRSFHLQKYALYVTLVTLIVLGTVSGVCAVSTWRMFAAGARNLPLVSQDVFTQCTPQNYSTISLCQDFLKNITQQSEKSLRYNLATAYLWSLFYLAFNIAHLIFAFKYWSLSLRIEQIILRHREYNKKVLKLRITFFILITMTIAASVLLIVEEYQFYIYLDFQTATPVAITAQSLEMAISLITLFILVGGVRRIQRCAEDCNEVAISKAQMMW